MKCKRLLPLQFGLRSTIPVGRRLPLWSFRTSKIVWVLVQVLLVNTCLCLAIDREKQLPKHYRDWLDHDVVYIINAEEKDTFLRLPDNAARDKFIEEFWQVRNPTLGAPNNPYRDEIYRRIAYANQNFGHETGTPGWRTDMGRIYITLGEPKQKGFYLGYNKLRPMQIWFYESANQALPPFFYIIFYQPEVGGDFKIYSPYVDGPEKLVTTESGSRIESWKIIDQQAGREVARTTLSLIPDEPVDITNARATLQSDVMLAAIHDLPNRPETKREINLRRQLLESVSHRVILGDEFLDSLVVPLRDTSGAIDLHFILRLHRPEDFAVAEGEGGRYYYSLEVLARVSTANKPVYERQTTITKYLDPGEMERIQHQALAYEGTLPIAPGKYKLQFILTNKLKQTAFRAEKDIDVPAPPAHGISITPLVPFADSVAADGPGAFTVAGVKFTPLLGPELDLNPGRNLKLFYQIWAPPRDPASLKDKTLSVQYAYGRPGLVGDFKLIHEEVVRTQFDPSGSLVSGKKISLLDAAAGNYRLAVTITDPDTQEKAYSSLNFHVLSNSSASGTWYVRARDSDKPPQAGTEEYERAECFLASGDRNTAVVWLRKALEENPANDQALASLIDTYFQKQAYGEVAALYPKIRITSETAASTILQVAESLDKGGDVKKATALLEDSLRLVGPDKLVYLRLASYYQQIGNSAKAAEFERKGESLQVTK